MPQYAAYIPEQDAHQPLADARRPRRDDGEIRLSPQEQILVEAGVRFLRPLSRWIWHLWASGKALPASGNLTQPLPLGAAWIAGAALAALAGKVNERLDASDLGEDEEHHLMNDLAAIQNAQEYLASAMPNIRRHLPFGLFQNRP